MDSMLSATLHSNHPRYAWEVSTLPNKGIYFH